MTDIILYVDSPIGIVSITKNVNSIAYNMNKISNKVVDEYTDLIDETDEAGVVILAGKYICVTSIKLKIKYYAMMFCDLNNDEVKAKQIIDSFENELTGIRFMERFFELKNMELNDIRPFTLRVGSAPIK